MFQRSVAGLLLFIIYFNGLICKEDATCKISIFVDDYKICIGEDMVANKVRIK